MSLPNEVSIIGCPKSYSSNPKSLNFLMFHLSVDSGIRVSSLILIKSLLKLSLFFCRSNICATFRKILMARLFNALINNFKISLPSISSLLILLPISWYDSLRGGLFIWIYKITTGHGYFTSVSQMILVTFIHFILLCFFAKIFWQMYSRITLSLHWGARRWN